MLNMEDQGNGVFFLKAGTPAPFQCPECEAIIPVASLDGKFGGVDRNQEFTQCWACEYYGLTIEFEVEWERTGVQ